MKHAHAETEKFGEKLAHLAEAYLGFEALKMGAEKIKEYVTSAIEGVSASKILAERVGMGAESFQRLAYAAKLAHVDQDGFAMSLGQMNKRLAEVAIEGSGPAAGALQRFGIQASELTKMGTEDAFFKLVGVLEQIENPAERAAVAMDFFGKSGQGIINLAARGSKELHELGDDASRLGIALSDVDTSKVEEADQAMMRLEAAGQGFANLIVTQLSPFLVDLIDRYIEWGYQGTKSASFVTQGMDWVVSGIGLALDAVNVFKAAFHSIEAVVANVVSGFLSGIVRILESVDFLASKLGQDSDLAGALKDWSKGFEVAAVQELDAAESAWAKIGAGHETVRKIVDDIQKGAQARAGKDVAKSKKFNASGELSQEKENDHKFAGAMELGSKEAYSSIVRAMTARGDSANVRTAGATERSAASLERMEKASMGGGLKRHEKKELAPNLAGAI